MVYKTITSTEHPNSESCGLSPNSVTTVLGTVSCVSQRAEQFVPVDSGNRCFISEYLRDSC